MPSLTIDLHDTNATFNQMLLTLDINKTETSIQMETFKYDDKGEEGGSEVASWIVEQKDLQHLADMLGLMSAMISNYLRGQS